MAFDDDFGKCSNCGKKLTFHNRSNDGDTCNTCYYNDEDEKPILKSKEETEK